LPKKYFLGLKNADGTPGVSDGKEENERERSMRKLSEQEIERIVSFPKKDWFIYV